MAPKPSEKLDKNGEPKQRKRPGRVPVSCAECRRLKLRCDRKVPCETCTKRGCAAICPEGSLTTGKGNRLALADAEELHKKVERLRNRVSSLEDALRTLQAAVSDDPHPLLQDDMIEDKDDSIRLTSPRNGPRLSREDEEFLDAFGTLTLGLRGESRFFGQTARSEYLIHAPEVMLPCSRQSFPHLSQDMVEAACMALEMPCNDLELKSKLFSMLPSLSRACRLCETFLEFGEFIWSGIPRNQLFDEILGVIYRSAPFGPEETNLVSSHALSLLFMVFALATLFDLESPPYADEAHEYFLLARLALRFAPPMQDTTLWAIQSLVYMAQFMELSDTEAAHSGSHKAWVHVGFAAKLGLSIGLHVASSRWQLDEDASQRRSRAFWQLFHQDTWISFGFGRPPCMSLAYVDCELPKDPEESVDAAGHRNWGFNQWTWQYSKVLHNVMTTAFGAKAPQYSTVLELDRKIRDFPLPWSLRIKCGQSEDPAPSNALRMQRWSVVACKESTLLNLHRPYFAQALNEQPLDLLRHRYGPSVMAIYRSAWRLIEGLRETYKYVPTVLSRMSLPWSQALSGAIVMCLLVTRAPVSSLAQSSLHELNVVCAQFEEARDKCRTAANNLTVMQKLLRQAHDASEKAECQDKSHPSFTELDRLGGKTHLISSASPTDRPLSRGAGSGTGSSMVASAIDPTAPCGPVSAENIHPTIMQDMRTFDAGITNPLTFAPFGAATNGLDLTPVFEQQSDVIQFYQQAIQTNPVTYRPFPDTYLPDDFFGAAANGGDNSQTPSSSGYGSNDSPESISAVGPPPVLDATWQSFVEQLGF